MNKKYFFSALVISLVFMGALPSIAKSATSSEVKSEVKVGSPEWKVKMHAMLADVMNLFPSVFDAAKFNDAKNSAAITQSMQSLVKHAAELKKYAGSNVDPSFPFIAEAFESELLQAQTMFAQEKDLRPQSQAYLGSALAKCALCHTQSANGPELKIEEFKTKFSSLSGIELFSALTATRQFDDALITFEKYARDAKVKNTDKKPGMQSFDRSARVALAIAIRVKKDAKRALSLIDSIQNSESGSAVLQNDLKGWKKAVIAWQGESTAILNTDQALFAEAKRLVEIGKRRDSSLESFDNSNVTGLRASAHLHDLLSNYPKSSLRAESYLLLASIYDSLAGFSIWDLSEQYLGACIQENPHSEVGERCFKEYNNSITIGYTGSSGTHIPKSVSQHLDRMRELSKPLSKTRAPKKK